MSQNCEQAGEAFVLTHLMCRLFILADLLHLLYEAFTEAEEQEVRREKMPE